MGPADGESPQLGEAPCLVGPAGRGVAPIGDGSLPRGPRGTGSRPASWAPRAGSSPIGGGSLPRGPRGTGSRPYWGRLPASWPPRDGESPQLGEAPCLVGPAGRGVAPIGGGCLVAPAGRGVASCAPRDVESPDRCPPRVLKRGPASSMGAPHCPPRPRDG